MEEENPRGKKRPSWWKGLRRGRKKDIAEAEKTLAELKVLGERYPNKQNIKIYWHLKGLIDLEKGDYPGGDRACLNGVRPGDEIPGIH